jgi:hypothetical protein
MLEFSGGGNKPDNDTPVRILSADNWTTTKGPRSYCLQTNIADEDSFDVSAVPFADVYSNDLVSLDDQR